MGMKPTFFKLSVLTAVASITVACQQTEQIKNMHDATHELRDTTKEMNSTTGGMKETTDNMLTEMSEMKSTTDEMLNEMKGLKQEMGDMSEVLGATKQNLVEMSKQTGALVQTTDGLCQGSRQALSQQSRDALLEAMISGSAAVGDKIVLAGKITKAYEFQVWGLCGTLDHHEREKLMESATLEFFFSIERFVSSSTYSNPLAEPSGDKHGRPTGGDKNLDASFNAVAATMHLLNHLQELMLEQQTAIAAKNKTQPPQEVSIYSMIKDGMRLEKAVNGGRIQLSQLKMYQRNVLNNRTLSLRLLQARHSFYTAAFLSKVVPFAPKTPANLAAMASNKLAKLGVPWKFSIDNFNAVQLSELALMLKASLETRAFLKDNGYPVVLDDELDAHLKGMTPFTEVASTGAPINNGRKEIIELVKKIKALR